MAYLCSCTYLFSNIMCMGYATSLIVSNPWIILEIKITTFVGLNLSSYLLRTWEFRNTL